MGVNNKNAVFRGERRDCIFKLDAQERRGKEVYSEGGGVRRKYHWQGNPETLCQGKKEPI